MRNIQTPRRVPPTQEKISSSKAQVQNGITWVDLENPTEAELQKLAHNYTLHSLHVEECLSKKQIPQMEIEKDYIFLLLYFPKYIAAENRITSSHVGIFLGKNFLLTVHGESTPTIRKLFETCEQDTDKRESLFKTSPGFLLYNLIGALLHELSGSINHVQEELDEIEERVFDGKNSDAYQIGQLRQKIMRLRRIIVSLRDILEELSGAIDEFTDENLARYYRNNTKIAGKLWDNAEEARETIEIYKDADFTTSTEKTNATLAVLTLLFTLTIPATIAGTFYGMNILLPGGISTGSWAFFGQYTTFKVIMLISLTSGLLMYWFFRKKRWV